MDVTQEDGNDRPSSASLPAIEGSQRSETVSTRFTLARKREVSVFFLDLKLSPSPNSV